MELPLQNSTSCLPNNTGLYLVVQDGMAGLAVVICGIVMVLIVCLKAYKTFIDRLVLDTTISAFLFTACLILETVTLIENKVKDNVFNGVCSAVSYLITFTSWMIILFLMVITLHLFLLVAFQVKVSKHEKLIVVSIPIISAVIATVPFMTKSYGFSDFYCWVKSREKDGQNQSIADFTEQIVLGYGPMMVVVTFNLFTAVYVTWVICRQRGARRQHMEAVKETIHLVLYPIFFELMNFELMANLTYYYIKGPSCWTITGLLTSIFTPLTIIGAPLALFFHVILTQYRRRKRQRTESETRYTVPPEFPSEMDPLVITGARPQEPETAYNTIYSTDSIN